jgi:hypothetical protein
MKTTEDRFWSKVKIGTPDECWEWQGGKLRDGYGSFVLDSRTKQHLQAHRYSYSIHNQNVKLGRNDFVCHKCDNPSCVNPNHLFLGNQKTNMQDRQNKQRQAKGEKISVLSTSEVQEIKSLIKTKVPRRTIASMFGVGSTTITNIATGRSWKWVE